MSEVTDLTVIEIKPEQAPVLYVAGGLDAYLEQIRQAVNEVPDLSTKKGLDRDVRTVVEMGKAISFDPKRDMPFEGTRHSALDDAIHQAKYVSAIWQKLVK
ncbi:3'-5' exonuclease [Enterobacter hormaechei]